MVRTCTGTTGACQQVNRLISQLPARGKQAGRTIQPDVRSLPKGTNVSASFVECHLDVIPYMFPIFLGTNFGHFSPQIWGFTEFVLKSIPQKYREYTSLLLPPHLGGQLQLLSIRGGRRPEQAERALHSRSQRDHRQDLSDPLGLVRHPHHLGHCEDD